MLPAHAAMVLFVVAASIFLATPFGLQQGIAKTGIASILLSSNFVIPTIFGNYFDAPAEANPLLHTWSLSIEEQFYLLFPIAFLVAFALLQTRSKQFLALATAFSFLFLGSLSFWLLDVSWNGVIRGGLFGYFGIVTRVWQFLAGALSMLAVHCFGRTSGRFAIGVSHVSLALIPFTIVWDWRSNDSEQVGSLIVTVLTATFLWSNEDCHRIPTTLMSRRALTWLGDRSYSIYLWHWPLVVFSSVVWPGSFSAKLFGAALSLVPATLSYRYLEPHRSLGTGDPSRSRSFGMVFIAIPAVLAGGLLGFGAQNRWWMDWSSGSAEERIADDAGCLDEKFNVDGCTWQLPNSEGRILLVGDSQAYALADGVISAAESLRMDVIVSARSGCPFSALQSTGDDVAGCRQWQRDVRAFVEDENPNIVLIANRSIGYTSPSLAWRVMLDENGTLASHGNAIDLYSKGLHRVVAELESAGADVIIISNPPEPMGNLSPESIFRRVFADYDKSFLRVEVDEIRRTVRNIELIVANDNGAETFDPVPELCDTERCPLYIDKEPLYQDPVHLSRRGSLQLKKGLVLQLKETLSKN